MVLHHIFVLVELGFKQMNIQTLHVMDGVSCLSKVESTFVVPLSLAESDAIAQLEQCSTSLRCFLQFQLY